jgi:hypothetical protein
MVDYGSLPFAEALEFFRRKLNMPTKKWDDLLGAAHDRAFVVAGAMQADLLMDLRAAVDKAIADGTTYETFKKDFKKIVAARGWTGWTGEGTKAGEAWRTRVIYDTNLFSSYSAGRYRQMKDVAASRPWWRYRHSPASRVPRAEHRAWDGVILRHDDPWWTTHAVPNGFGCKCYIETLADRDLKRLGLEPTPQEQIPYNAIDPKTGLPQGVDKGWDYQPGASVAEELDKLKKIETEKVAKLDSGMESFSDRMKRLDQEKQAAYRKSEGLIPEAVRQELFRMRDTAGWAEKGGHLIRDAEGNPVGRTKWVAKADWFADYKAMHGGKGLKAGQMPQVIEHILQGKITKAGQALLDWLAEYHAEQQRMQADYAQAMAVLDDESEALFNRVKGQFLQKVSGVGESVLDAITEEFYSTHPGATQQEAHQFLMGELQTFLDESE